LHQNSNTSIEDDLQHKPLKSALLSGYSHFLESSGMNRPSYFHDAIMHNNKLDVKDIEGATPYIKQLSTAQPIVTNYDKNETFENYKHSFIQRR